MSSFEIMILSDGYLPLQHLPFHHVPSAPHLAVSLSSRFQDQMASSRGSVHSSGDQVSCDQYTMAMINRYLQTTGIEAAFKEQCHQLLKSPHLPYNPYPSLVRQLRAYVERWVTWLSHNIKLNCSSCRGYPYNILLYSFWVTTTKANL